MRTSAVPAAAAVTATVRRHLRDPPESDRPEGDERRVGEQEEVDETGVESSE